MLRLTKILVLLLVLLAAGACGGLDTGEPLDLGDLGATKADTAGITVPFRVPAGEGGEPGRVLFFFRTVGRLAITTSQDEPRQRLQLVAESDSYRRRSWRGRSPFLTIPGVRAGGMETAYELELLNWGSEDSSGVLNVEVENAPSPGVEAVFNQPDCEECEDRTGGLRDAIVDEIQSARATIDAALYGLDDERIIEALCNAVDAGVAVRVITDDGSLDPDDSRSYYRGLFDEIEGLAGCGVEVDVVASNGIMHHKFYLIDASTDAPVLVTGSANQTAAGFEVNHNHMLFVRGAPELMDAYGEEFDQFWRHCAEDRLDGREARCSECTPGCVEDRSEEGPWTVGNTRVEAYFAPSDDTLRVLRGASRSRRLDEPDPECSGPDSSCLCRPSGSGFMCEYCAQGDDGFGLIGEAEERIVMSLYSATDMCFARAVERAVARGVPTLSVWDRVHAGGPYARDEQVCASGAEVLLSIWDDGSAQARNHNKFIVVDDVVFDGSMNFSAAGAGINNENTLLLESSSLADQFVHYVEEEAALLRSMGAQSRDPADCLCSDGLDNDGDGLSDGADDDCDAGTGASGRPR